MEVLHPRDLLNLSPEFQIGDLLPSSRLQSHLGVEQSFSDLVIPRELLPQELVVSDGLRPPFELRVSEHGDNYQPKTSQENQGSRRLISSPCHWRQPFGGEPLHSWGGF